MAGKPCRKGGFIVLCFIWICNKIMTDGVMVHQTSANVTYPVHICQDCADKLGLKPGDDLPSASAIVDALLISRN